MTTPAVTDEQRERHIQACGRHVLACYAAGDRETARNWLAAQNAAIRERTPAQVARMERERMGCYFMAEGDRARLAAGRARA